MAVNGQLRTPAALPPVKKSPVLFRSEVWWASSVGFEEVESLFHIPGIETLLHIQSIITARSIP